MTDRGVWLEYVETIPEPHAFTATLRLADQTHTVAFEEHEHVDDASHRDNNMRAAVIHVFADAAVSDLGIVGLLLASSAPSPSRAGRGA